MSVHHVTKGITEQRKREPQGWNLSPTWDFPTVPTTVIPEGKLCVSTLEIRSPGLEDLYGSDSYSETYTISHLLVRLDKALLDIKDSLSLSLSLEKWCPLNPETGSSEFLRVTATELSHRSWGPSNCQPALSLMAP